MVLRTALRYVSLSILLSANRHKLVKSFFPFFFHQTSTHIAYARKRELRRLRKKKRKRKKIDLELLYSRIKRFVWFMLGKRESKLSEIPLFLSLSLRGKLKYFSFAVNYIKSSYEIHLAKYGNVIESYWREEQCITARYYIYISSVLQERNFRRANLIQVTIR